MKRIVVTILLVCMCLTAVAEDVLKTKDVVLSRLEELQDKDVLTELECELYIRYMKITMYTLVVQETGGEHEDNAILASDAVRDCIAEFEEYRDAGLMSFNEIISYLSGVTDEILKEDVSSNIEFYHLLELQHRIEAGKTLTKSEGWYYLYSIRTYINLLDVNDIESLTLNEDMIRTSLNATKIILDYIDEQEEKYRNGNATLDEILQPIARVVQPMIDAE